MKVKLFTAALGLLLIAFGFSLRPVHSDSKHFAPNKSLMKSRVSPPSPLELQNSLRSFMSSHEKYLYNQVRKIVSDKDLTTQEKVDKIVEFSEAKELTKANKSMILNTAVTLANNALEGEEREQALKKLDQENSQAKWLLKRSPNPNLMKLSRLQYRILTGRADL